MGGVSADGKILWLSGRYNSEVYAISTKDGKLLARIPVGSGPHGLCVYPQPGRYSLGPHGGVSMIAGRAAAASRPRFGASAVLAVLAAITLAGMAGCGGGASVTGAGTTSRSAQRSKARPPAPKLRVKASPARLPAPVSGETVVSEGKSLLVIGGLKEGDVSIASIVRLDPKSGSSGSAGALSQPLHDAAATKTAAGTLVFGGGSAATIDQVERLVPGATGEVIGRLPVPRSDLSAVSVGACAYVLAGYDGQGTVGPILKTRDGTSFKELAKMPVPVRYAAVVPRGQMIYSFGGEDSSGQDSDVIQRVDTATGRTSILGHLPGPLAHASAVALDGRIYLLGGRLSGATTDQILRFDPATGSSTVVGHLPAPLQNAAAAVIGGVGYLVGGLTPEEAPVASIVTMRLSR